MAAEQIQDAILAETIGSLVHEAVHVRIERWGSRTGGDRQARIEPRCLAEQVDTLLRCALISAETGQKNMAILSIEWWTTAAHRRDVRQLMLKAGLPLWVARLLVPFEFGRGAK